MNSIALHAPDRLEGGRHPGALARYLRGLFRGRTAHPASAAPALGAATVDVAFGKPCRMALALDARITCLEGTAWLTKDGCLADTILSPGQAARVSGADGALIVGMPRCRLRIAREAA